VSTGWDGTRANQTARDNNVPTSAQCRCETGDKSCVPGAVAGSMSAMIEDPCGTLSRIAKEKIRQCGSVADVGTWGNSPADI
jgi:hypothetical protein